MSLKILSIRAKLVAAFATLTAFLLGLGMLGLVGVSSVNGLLVDVRTNWLPSMRDAGVVDALTGRYTTSLLRHMLTTEPKALAAIDVDIAQRNRRSTRRSRPTSATSAPPRSGRCTRPS